MSIYLVYFERNKFHENTLNKKLKSNLLGQASKLNTIGLKSDEITVRIEEKQNPIKGIVIHDGVASDRFLRFGKDAISRQGHVYRKAFTEFIVSRMNEYPIDSYFIFKNFTDSVLEIHITLHSNKRIDKKYISDALLDIKIDELIEVY